MFKNEIIGYFKLFMYVNVICVYLLLLYVYLSFFCEVKEYRLIDEV